MSSKNLKQSPKQCYEKPEIFIRYFFFFQLFSVIERLIRNQLDDKKIKI